MDEDGSVRTEEEFTRGVVIPLLKRLGYHDVTYSHGVHEFGKDVVFAEYDRFGLTRWYAAQVKLGDVDGKAGRGVDEIESQVRTALRVGFDDLTTKERVFLSSVYVIVSGKFTNNAKTMLLERLRDLRNWVHFVDGKRLARLNEARLRDVAQSLSRLIGETDSNLDFCRTVETMAGERKTYLYYEYAIGELLRTASELGAFGPGGEFVRLVEDLESLRVELVKSNNALRLLPLSRAVYESAPEYAYLLERAKALAKFLPTVRAGVVNALREMNQSCAEGGAGLLSTQGRLD